MKERGRTGDSEAPGKQERLLPSGSPKRVGQEAREGRISSPRGPNPGKARVHSNRKQMRQSRGCWWQTTERLLKEMRMNSFQDKG